MLRYLLSPAVALHAGLYLSILVALCLLVLLMLCLYMASLPAPVSSGVAPASPASVGASGALHDGGNLPEPDGINQNIVKALQDADENLKKRIIALATKVCVPSNIAAAIGCWYCLCKGCRQHMMCSKNNTKGACFQATPRAYLLQHMLELNIASC